MKLKVNVFIGDKKIPQSELHKIVIKNKDIDRIVNAVVDRQIAAIEQKVS